MLKVICINGISRAGKDTFIDYVEKRIGVEQVARISTIDPIKELYSEFFQWDGVKSPEVRKNLNTLKNIWSFACNGPLNYSFTNIKNSHNDGVQYLFIMVREFDEMINTKKLAEAHKFSAYTLQVVRDLDNIPPVEQEFLDSHPEDFVYDITVNNPTVSTYPDLPSMRKTVEDFLLLTKYEAPKTEFR